MKRAFKALQWLLVALLLLGKEMGQTLDRWLFAHMVRLGAVMGIGTIEQLSEEGPQADGTVAMNNANCAFSVYGPGPQGPVTQPTNPLQSQASYALGQSAVVVYFTSQSPAAVNANTSVEQALTVTGLAASSLAFINKPTAQAGLGTHTARVSAANTLQVKFSNVTGGNITPTGSEVYIVTEIRGPLLQTAALVFTGLGATPTLTTAEYTFTLTPGTLGGVLGQGLASAQHALTSGILSMTGATAAAPQPILAGTSVPAGTSMPGLTGINIPAFATGRLPQSVVATKPTDQAGLVLMNVRVSGNNSISLAFMNTSVAGITPTNETYTWFACNGISLRTPNIQYFVNVGTLGAATATDTTTYSLTVNGVAVGDRVTGIFKPTEQAHLGGWTARVSAANTLILGVIDPNAAGATPTASEVWVFNVDPTARGVGQIFTQFSLLFTPIATATITSAEQTFAVTGLVATSPLLANFYSAPAAVGTTGQLGAATGFGAGLGTALQVSIGVGGVRVSATNTLAVVFINPTASAGVVPAQMMCTLLMGRPDQSGSTLGAAGSCTLYPVDQQAYQQQNMMVAMYDALVLMAAIKGS